MEPYDLAWKGTTIEEKRQLLDHSLKERDKRIADGKSKDGQLMVASTCVDIIGTANSIIKDSESTLKESWQELLDECVQISKDAVEKAEKTDKNAWLPNDYENAGAIIISTSFGDKDELNHAIQLLEEGLTKAEASGNKESSALLSAQLILAAVGMEDPALVQKYAKNVATMKENDINPKALTRVFRKLAKGYKFLAVHYAKEAGSPNQELKAQGI